MPDYNQEAVTIMKLLSNTHRLEILSLLKKSKKDLCVYQIAEGVGISQSLASHQLAYLDARKVIEGERMGQTTCYRLSKNPITKKIVSIIKLLK